jgi:hypothetical protein
MARSGSNLFARDVSQMPKIKQNNFLLGRLKGALAINANELETKSTASRPDLTDSTDF